MCRAEKPAVCPMHGIIVGEKVDKHRHISTDNMSGKGDSGGDIFSVSTGKLMGMMVG